MEDRWMHPGAFAQQDAMAASSRLQDAQALAIARQSGQSATSQQYIGGGGSPLAQSIKRAKKLAATQLDPEGLSDEQKDMIAQMTEDPNVGADDFQRQLTGLVSQQKFSTTEQDKQNAIEAKSTAASEKAATSQANAQGRATLRQYAAQQRALQQQISQHEKMLTQYGYDTEKLDPTAPPEVQAAFNSLHQARQQLDSLSQQADQTIGTLGHGAPQAAAPAKPQGTISIKQNPAGPHGALKPGFRGPPSIDIVHHYLNQTGNNPDAARAAARADGWAV
jgi:hypothetical protein